MRTVTAQASSDGRSPRLQTTTHMHNNLPKTPMHA